MHDNKNGVNYMEDTSPQWRESMIKYLTVSLSTNKNKVLYLLGSTHANKDRLKSFLRNSKNIEIVYLRRQKFEKLLYKFLFFIPRPLCFLIKIKESESLRDTLLNFDEPSLHEIFYFDIVLEEEFLNTASKDKYCMGFDLEKIIQKDNSYLLIGIDTDSIESETGFMKKISYGHDTPKSLTWYL